MCGMPLHLLCVPGGHPTLNTLVETAHFIHLSSGKGIVEYLYTKKDSRAGLLIPRPKNNSPATNQDDYGLIIDTQQQMYASIRHVSVPNTKFPREYLQFPA